MLTTHTLFPHVTLRHYRDTRFKQGRLTIQFLRQMKKEEAAMNALLPVVLLRGTRKHPDLRAITMRLDNLYGTNAAEMVRRIGDYQTTGFVFSFTEDRFALAGDAIFAGMAEFARELLLEPLTENGCFCREFVESEKKNLLSELEAIRNDKAAYAGSRMLELLCGDDSFAVPRLGDKKTLGAITPESLYAHYEAVLRESPVELFYVGSAPADAVAAELSAIFAGMDREVSALPEQKAFPGCPLRQVTETMDIAQSRLNLGFVTDITCRDSRYAAFLMFNAVYGAGTASKLFVNVREKMSLCYAVGSDFYGTKGIFTVSAGIDGAKREIAHGELLRQLRLCQAGEITDEEILCARTAMLSSLRTISDSPRSLEGYYASAFLNGRDPDIGRYRQSIQAVTKADIVAAANTVTLCCDYFLEGQ